MSKLTELEKPELEGAERRQQMTRQRALRNQLDPAAMTVAPHVPNPVREIRCAGCRVLSDKRCESWCPIAAAAGAFDVDLDDPADELEVEVDDA